MTSLEYLNNHLHRRSGRRQVIHSPYEMNSMNQTYLAENLPEQYNAIW
jgi:hypothetical protein